MKRRLFVLVVLLAGVLLFLGWYLRASIYWEMGEAQVYPPALTDSYTFGNESLEERTYVALGDSLTAGVGVDSYEASYPYKVAQLMAGDSKRVVLHPYAVSGVRSEYVLEHFIEPAIAADPDVITLLIGTNDIHGNVPVDPFRENYSQILAVLTERTDADIYVVSLPSIGTSDLISPPYLYYYDDRTVAFNTVIAELADMYSVTYIDLYSAHMPHALDTAYYSRDYFHPNALGYTLWADTIYANIRH